MAADAARFGRLDKMFGSARADGIGSRYFSGVRRYYVVNATFGAIVAVLDGLLLWALGIPIPIVWAILAFVTNFVPNIGFVLGLIPPAVLALVVGGWPLALVVVLAYSVINVTLQVLIQPKFVPVARRILKPGGRLQVVTDHQGYWEENIEPTVRAAEGFTVVDYNRPDSAGEGEFVGTNFERKYRREGRPFYAIAAVKNG